MKKRSKAKNKRGYYLSIKLDKILKEMFDNHDKFKVEWDGKEKENE